MDVIYDFASCKSVNLTEIKLFSKLAEMMSQRLSKNPGRVIFS